jgi:WD40 repeat protein
VILILIFGPYLSLNEKAIDVTKFTELKTFYSSSVNSVAWSPDGNKLASGSEYKTITIWDTITGAILDTLNGHTNEVTSVAWNPNGSLLASTSVDKTIKIWNMTTGTNLKTFTGHTDGISSIAWSPDGSKLASGSWDKSIIIWNMTTGEIIKNCTGHVGGVISVAWSPDGERLASGSNDDTVKIWSVATGKNILTLAPFGHTNSVNSVAWNPNGSLLASGSNDVTIKIWNLTTQNDIKTLQDTACIYSIAWSPDGSKVASGNCDGSIKIWDIATGINLQTLIVSPSFSLTSVAWSPNGKKIAAGSTDGTTTIWGENNSATFSNVYLYSMTVDKRNITIDENIIITATLSNNGTADGLNNKLDFYDGTIFLTTKYINVIHGGTNIVSYLWQTTETTHLGPHNLRVLFGTEEKNVTVIVKGKPNIFIKDLVAEKSNICIGEKANITATIANNGTTDGIDIIVNLYDSEKSLITQSINVSRNGTGIIEYSWTTNNSTYIGIHNFRAVVETHEKNVTISVNGKPNIYIVDMFVDIINITKGKSAIITAFIKNNGTADAINVDVRYYQDNILLTTKRENITKGQTITTAFKWNTENITLGNHVLKIVVDNSVKERTVHVNKGPMMFFLSSSFPFWIVLLIILAVVVVILVCGYKYYKNQKRRYK